MDDKITAVLEAYHELIAAEHNPPAEGPEERREPTPREPARREPMGPLRAIGPESGQFINLLVRSMPSPTVLELGTSYGYSGIWLAEATRASGGRMITVELDEEKSRFAQEMSQRAGLADHVEFRVGDAVEVMESLPDRLDFVLLDLDKPFYLPSMEVFLPKLKPGAIVVADNIIRPPNEHVQAYVQAIRARPGISSVQLPIGNGLEVSRLAAQPA